MWVKLSKAKRVFILVFIFMMLQTFTKTKSQKKVVESHLSLPFHLTSSPFQCSNFLSLLHLVTSPPFFIVLWQQAKTAHNPYITAFHKSFHLHGPLQFLSMVISSPLSHREKNPIVFKSLVSLWNKIIFLKHIAALSEAKAGFTLRSNAFTISFERIGEN